MKYAYLYLVVFVINKLMALVVYVLLPDYVCLIMDEDSLVEYTSALIFLYAFIMAGSSFLKSKEYRKAVIVVFVIGLLGFLDEMSYGERLFGIETSYIYDIKIDGLHDFFLVGCIMLNKSLHSHALYLCPIALVAAAALLITLYKYRLILIKAIVTKYIYPPYIFLFFFIVTIFPALIIDLDLLDLDLLYMLEELLEMDAALALLFFCWSIPPSSEYGQKYQPIE
jgi:hypothetical protein